MEASNGEDPSLPTTVAATPEAVLATTATPATPMHSTGPGAVPKIVHQTWKTHKLPPDFKAWRQRCKDLNKGWEFWMWTDEDNLDLVKEKFPMLLPTYEGYDRNIKRVDAARYLILHQYGGVYMDLDMTCLRPFGEDTFSRNDTLYVADQFRKGGSWQMHANAFMASPPGHPVLAEVIRRLPGAADQGVLNATGPGMLTSAVRSANYKDVYAFGIDEIYGQEWNERKCRSADACLQKHIGGITVSFWSGTWTNKNNGKNKIKVVARKPRLFHVHRMDPKNIGDMLASPLNYLPDLKRHVTKTFDIYESADRNIMEHNISREDVVIIGGGGLLNCLNGWNRHIRQYCATAKCILWSVGRNLHTGTSLAREITADELKRVSITFNTRDSTELKAKRTLLDTTCLHPVFDEPCGSEGEGHGYYMHKSFRGGKSGTDVMYNNVTSIKKVKAFMCRFQTVTTSSYHGLLWSFYLGRKVKVMNTFSEKFKLVPFNYTTDNGPEMLKKCRSKNMAFYEEHIVPLW